MPTSGFGKEHTMAKRRITQIALLVNDYDEAIQFYTEKLAFTLVEDTVLSDTKRWVRISPTDGDGFCLLLAKAATAEQQAFVGNQSGGRVFLFMNTDDFWRDYERMRANAVQFIREPIVEPYGTVAVFADLYGNQWDLIGH